MKYLVGVKEVWEQMYEVEAESVDEARDKVEKDITIAEQEGVVLLEDGFELSHTLEKEYWNVYDVEVGKGGNS
ncbi:MAG: hypothetical protein ACOC1X_00960 [Promethearchaeota archaeon]